jgi:hypothetical protein
VRVRIVDGKRGQNPIVAVYGPDGLPCWKKAFKRRRDAVRAAKRRPYPLKVYRCQHCHRHHLTSDLSGPGRAY